MAVYSILLSINFFICTKSFCSEPRLKALKGLRPWLDTRAFKDYGLLWRLEGCVEASQSNPFSTCRGARVAVVAGSDHTEVRAARSLSEVAWCDR